MRDIRVIALDLDGTLLDSQKGLSMVNAEALAYANSKGVAVVPTTGRFFGMMPEAVRSLPFVRYAITINGAQVYDRERDEAIVREEIEVERAIAIMQLLDGYDVIYDCYRNNWGWMSASLQNRAEAYATDAHYLKMVRDFRKPVADLKEHLRATAEEGGIQKVMLFSRNDDPETKELCAIRAAMTEKFPEIKVTSSTWNDLEFNSPLAHKGNALARFAEHLGCTIDNCMSFGDGLNDLTMIEAAGIGVAMANARDEVKSVADYITSTNDDDGVAKA
ncbi:MAG: HAD family phosphatase, partial [Kiritimatiellae bacterium]|nr:HAD family phosphatase [Kiritimatiellia bacterium]